MKETPKRDETPTDSRASERRERRGYLWGALLALLLTAIPFAMVQWKAVPYRMLLGSIGVLALVQMVVHFRFFLHIGSSKNKEDLHLIIFSSLILLIMIAGTVWIMASLATRMAMTMPP